MLRLSLALAGLETTSGFLCYKGHCWKKLGLGKGTVTMEPVQPPPTCSFSECLALGREVNGILRL